MILEMILSLLSFFLSEPLLLAQEKSVPSVSRTISGEDQDKDGFFGTKDFCPKIPGKNKGCPSIQLFRGKNTHDIVFMLLTEARFFIKEKDEIRLGDIFSAGFRDKKTGKIWSESEALEVTQ